MGAAASAKKARPILEPTADELSQLEDPVRRSDEEMLFPCLPQSDEMKKKAPLMTLELSRTGFRLLRPATRDSLYLFYWGAIHSWSNTETNFTFKYFDDAEKTILQCVLFFKSTDPLLAHIQAIINKILAERKSAAVSQEAFDRLVAAVTKAYNSPDTQLELIKDLAGTGAYFWADQGRQLLDLLPTNFEKVEAATLLHGHLIDQNRFSYMLEALDCPTDRDNVWHRITMLKRTASRVQRLAMG